MSIRVYVCIYTCMGVTYECLRTWVHDYMDICVRGYMSVGIYVCICVSQCVQFRHGGIVDFVHAK